MSHCRKSRPFASAIAVTILFAATASAAPGSSQAGGVPELRRALEEALAANAAQLADFEARLAALESALAALLASDAAQDAALASLDGRVSSIEAGNVARDASIASLEARMSAAEATNAAQDGVLGSLDDRVTVLEDLVAGLDDPLVLVKAAREPVQVLPADGCATIDYDDVLIDTAGTVTVAPFTFTAPSEGAYEVTARIYLAPVGPTHRVGWQGDDVRCAVLVEDAPGSGTYSREDVIGYDEGDFIRNDAILNDAKRFSCAGTALVELAAGQSIRLEACTTSPASPPTQFGTDGGAASNHVTVRRIGQP